MDVDLYLSKPFGIDLLMVILTNLFRTRNELKRWYAQPELNLSTRNITFINADELFVDRLVNLIQKRLDDLEMRIDELASDWFCQSTILQHGF